MRLGGQYRKKGGGRYRALVAGGGASGGAQVRYDILAPWVLETVAMLRPADVLDRPAEATEREQEIARLAARATALLLREEELKAAAADPGQELGAILGAMRQVSDERAKVAAERDRLKLESRCGRAEALAEVQETLRAKRDAATGEAREELDRRIQDALPSVIAEIWVQGQRLSLRKSIVHVQVWLRNGSMRYFALLPKGGANGVKPWQLGPNDGVDLRRGPFIPTGDDRHVAAVAEPA
jgi:hypothetical protein